MSGLWIGLLLAGALVALAFPFPGPAPGPRVVQWPARPHWKRQDGAGAKTRVDLLDMPLFVHELTGLLRAGRHRSELWEDMERVYERIACQENARFAAQALIVLRSARRSAALGLSVPAVLRTTAAGLPDPGNRSGPTPRRLWVDLAACLDVAERSGAPLADILARYAAQLDAELDAAAARETALAGPKATATLLLWLPAAGLMLGFAMGVNPVTVLTGSPVGWALLACGGLLIFTGRWWTRRLIRSVESPGAPRRNWRARRRGAEGGRS